MSLVVTLATILVYLGARSTQRFDCTFRLSCDGFHHLPAALKSVVLAKEAEPSIGSFGDCYGCSNHFLPQPCSSAPHFHANHYLRSDIPAFFDSIRIRAWYIANARKRRWVRERHCYSLCIAFGTLPACDCCCAKWLVRVFRAAISRNISLLQLAFLCMKQVLLQTLRTKNS